MKILVADDETELLGLLKFTLTQTGFEVLTAADGPTALATFRKELPDCALLDVNMPHLDGLDVCREIRRHSIIPIMMLTVRDQEEDLVAALESGADDFVTKPFSPRVLLARLRALARRAEKTAPPEFIETGIARFDGHESNATARRG
jgi:DNA-binding response OmpR family regulator